MPQLHVSIVVNTYNRASSLERLLRSLSHLDYRPLEVVVVNGPSTDGTEALLARHRGRIKVGSCPAPNLSQSRNIGIALAAGDVVAFIDDDALPAETDWLTRLVSPFADDLDGSIGATGGATLHRDTQWYEFSEGFTSDYAEQVFQGSNDADARPAAAGRWFRRSVGNNCAFLRRALVAVGGFDEHYEYYLDETDVCVRMARAGFTTVTVPNCLVRHYPAPSPHGAPFIRNRRIITRSDTYFCLKNGGDALPWRVAKTFWLAPRKHFVTEMRSRRAEGTLSGRDYRRFRLGWMRGLVEGAWRGLFKRTRTTLNEADPPAFVPFCEGRSDYRLSIALLSRGVPPDPRGGGIGRYTYDLALGLHELGHRVTIVTESPVPERREALDFVVAGVAPALLAQPGLRHVPVLANNLAYAQSVADFLRARPGEFDVVHASSWGLESLGVLSWDGLPVVLFLVTPLERVMDAEGWSRNEDLLANITLDQWVLEHATRVCVPSNGVLGSYAARRNGIAPAATVVPLGITPGHGRRTPDVSGSRRLLFVGRLERRKGIEPLFDALPSLLEKHPDWVCDLVGDRSVAAAPGETFEGRFLARHRGAAWLSRVRFRGVVDDEALQDYYASADLFVAPSLYESFGLIYLEAAQYGVPVVGCRTGGVPEVVNDGEDGLLVSPGDAAALRDALDRLMGDGDLRTRLGRNGAEKFRRSMTHLALAERMVLQYRETFDAYQAATSWSSERTDVVAAALDVLEREPATAGIGYAIRAAAAFERKDMGEASHLIAQALGVVHQPQYLAMAVEVALATGDREQAVRLAEDGVSSTGEVDQQLLFGAVIDAAAGWKVASAPAEIGRAWRNAAGPGLAERWFRAGVEAIRGGRDASARLLLERALAASGPDAGSWRDQARYHLASILKRQGDGQAATSLLSALEDDGGITRLPKPIAAAANFHRGELELTAGNARAAREYLKRCLDLTPEHRRAREFLAASAEVGAGDGAR